MQGLRQRQSQSQSYRERTHQGPTLGSACVSIARQRRSSSGLGAVTKGTPKAKAAASLLTATNCWVPSLHSRCPPQYCLFTRSSPHLLANRIGCRCFDASATGFSDIDGARPQSEVPKTLSSTR
eukprot:358016-Chlamydomonas_euryale.AAC.3